VGAFGLSCSSVAQVIIINAVRAKITHPAMDMPNIPLEHNPYRWFSFLLKNAAKLMLGSRLFSSSTVNTR
jgi:hypothetical protein